MSDAFLCFVFASWPPDFRVHHCSGTLLQEHPQTQANIFARCPARLTIGDSTWPHDEFTMAAAITSFCGLLLFGHGCAVEQH